MHIGYYAFKFIPVGNLFLNFIPPVIRIGIYTGQIHIKNIFFILVQDIIVVGNFLHARVNYKVFLFITVCEVYHGSNAGQKIDFIGDVNLRT